MILLVMMLPIIASAAFAVDPGLSWEPLSQFLRMMVIVWLILILIETEAQLRILVLVMAASLGFLGTKFGVFGLVHQGVRFNQGYGGLMSDNNSMALAFAMTVPLCWFAARLVTAYWAKAMFFVMSVSTCAAVVMSFSRGAAIALAGCFGMIILRSKHKIAILVLLAILITPSILMVKEAYFQRLSTLTNPEEEASAYSRLMLMRVSFLMAKDYPFVGVGYGKLNQQVLIAQYMPPELAEVYATKVIHNTYLQMLVDSGAFALLIYLALLAGTILWLGRTIRKYRHTQPAFANYAAMLQSVIITFAIGAIFLSRVEFDLYYFVLMAAAVLYELTKRVPEAAPVAVQVPVFPAGSAYQPGLGSKGLVRR
jgi:probable O-glycosylation ligase (exosortase A-associated)